MTEPEVEALRRRLYAPGASGDDVAAYSAAVSPVVEEPSAPLPARRRLRRTVVLVGAAAALVVAVLVAALLPRPTTRPAATLPSPVALPLYAPERTAMVRHLAEGEDAGITAYLISRQTSSQLPGPVPLAITEDHGRGPAVVRLDGDPLEGDAGRATVLLVLGTDAPATWSADRLIIDRDHAVRPSPLHREGGAQVSGELTAATFAYGAGQRPVRLRIDVPAGIRWGVAVAVGR